MSETKAHQRRFSLEDDFMNYDTDDLLFGAMYHLSTYHPDYRKLYLSRKSLLKNKKIIYELCGLNSQKLNRHLEKLIERKLIAVEEMIVAGEKVPVYTFPYDYKSNYQLIDNEMLWYLASTRNHQCIRVYVLLLKYYLWKQKVSQEQGEDVYYVFTNADLLKDIGYSADNKVASSVITNILESFQREGLIQYEEFYEEIITNKGISVPSPRKRLKFVAKVKTDMRPVE
jgi:hypothetical protein